MQGIIGKLFDGIAIRSNRWWRLMHMLLPYRRSGVAFILSVLGNSLFGLATPIISGAAIDALTHRQLGRIVLLTACEVVAACCAALARFCQNRACGYVSRSVGADLSDRLFTQVQRLPISYFKFRTSGELITLLRLDVDQVTGIIYSSVMPFLVSVVTIIATAISMLALNWRLFLSCILIVPMWVFVSRTSGNALAPLHYSRRGLSDDHNAIVTDRLSLTGAVRVKTQVQYSRDRSDYLRVLQPLTKLSERLVDAHGLTNVATAFISSFGPAAVIVVGAWLYVHHQTTIGTLTAFLAMQARLFSPVQSVIGIRGDMLRAAASLERIFDAFDAEREPTGDLTLHAEPPIHLDRVTVRFGDVKVLNSLSLQIQPLDHIAIVGKSGAGKSTLLHLILGLYRPDEGHVLINCVDARDLNVDCLRAMVSYVPQESGLLSGTIRANLVYGSDNCDDARMWDALTVVDLDAKVRSLPSGLDSSVGIGGALLSGGERQRLAIARALLQDRAVFIFDEATSAIDIVSERKIIEAVRSRLVNNTLIVISHRLSSLAGFPRVVVLNDGCIEEDGAYADLLADSATFAMMHG